MRRIALLNQKGGVGKTTSTANIGASLATLGRRVLLLDVDPQSNLTVHFGVNPYELEASMYDLIMGECSIDQVLIKTEVPGLDLVPANIDLAGAEIELAGVIGREIILKEKIEELSEGSYDYLMIDCPPSLGLLSLNALTSVSELIIPLQVEFFALQGMSQLLRTFERVKKRLNHELEITGIIPCMFDARTRLSQEVLENIQEYFADKVFNTVVRKNVKLAESPSHGMPIIAYKPKAMGATDYMALAREIIAQEAHGQEPEPAPKSAATPELPQQAIPLVDPPGDGDSPQPNTQDSLQQPTRSDQAQQPGI